MHEVKRTLKRLAVYYLLLAVNILFCANIIADVFPTRNFSTIYLLVLSVCLVLYYSHRVTPTGGIALNMKALSWMGLLLILLRGIKYSVVAEVGVLARHAWYLYYVPILLLPLFLFYISLLVSAKDDARVPKAWYWTLGLTLVALSQALVGIAWAWWSAILLTLTLGAVLLLVGNARYEKSHVTPNSIKLYLDKMPCGVCCWRDNGRVIFPNICMNRLCLALTESPLRNGNQFYEAVAEGIVSVGDEFVLSVRFPTQNRSNG